MFFLLFFMLNKEYFKHGLLTTLLTQTEMKNYLPDVIFTSPCSKISDFLMVFWNKP